MFSNCVPYKVFHFPPFVPLSFLLTSSSLLLGISFENLVSQFLETGFTKNWQSGRFGCLGTGYLQQYQQGECAAFCLSPFLSLPASPSLSFIF